MFYQYAWMMDQTWIMPHPPIQNLTPQVFQDSNALPPPVAPILPILLGGDPLAVPHCRDPFLAFMQRAAGMFSVPIVHGHPRLRVAGVEEVSKKEHLLALGDDLEAYACEECVAAALGDGAIGEAGGDSGTEGVRVTAALAITVGSILVTCGERTPW